MPEPKLSERSRRCLTGVDPRLVAVIKAAIYTAEEETAPPMTVTVTEGLRTVERQRELVAKGASKTMKSRHIDGQAVDVMVNKGWKFADYEAFARIVKQKAQEQGVRVTWGGDWTTFKDGPHFQIEP